MIASGGDDGDLSLARMVSRRPFSGYWEYHIDGALFTAPARTDHSGAGLFNADGELVGIGSLIVARRARQRDQPRMRGNMFVPVDLLKPILAELRDARQLARQQPRLARPQLRRGRRPGARRPPVRRQPGRGGRPAARRPDRRRSTARRVADLASFYKTLWRDERPEREVALEIRRDGETQRLTVHAVDRMKTLSRPRGVLSRPGPLRLREGC